MADSCDDPLVDDDRTLAVMLLTIKDGLPVKVRVVSAPTGKKSKSSYVWQFMRQFQPLVNNINIDCAAPVRRKHES